MIKIKGYEFQAPIVKDSFNRRAVAFSNSIIENLKRIGIEEDQIEVKLEPIAIARKPAVISWYFDGGYYHYSYNNSKFVDNLAVVSKLIQLMTNDLISGELSPEDFLSHFKEQDGIEKKRQEAREYFGLEENFSIEDVNKTYKTLAKDLHPDMPNGSVEEFKKLNEAHKILKREFS